jgi:epoxyqueuosine reductase
MSEYQRRLAELKNQLSQGKLSRRDFIRSAALFGLSLGASEILAACGLQSAPTPYPTAYDPVFSDPTLVAIGKEMVLEGASNATPEPGSSSEPQPRPTFAPRREFTWMCVSCGERFSSIEKLQKHAVEIHGKRLPDIKQVDQPTYSQYLVGDVQRFDERNTVFSRTTWDTDYQAQVQAASMKAPEGDWETQEGQALVAGAIYVDDTAGALHPYYGGYFGHIKGDTGLYGWEDPVNTVQFPVPDPAWMTERIKTVARLYGADLVGITKVNPLWVYSHYYEAITGNYDRLEIPFQNAIVMGIEMDWDSINTSPDYPASAATALGYSRMSELSSSLAKYIRTLGYAALPCGNDSAQSIPLAIDAGLGEVGRNGLLLSPEFGPRQRICKVFTDLPLAPDKPIDFGVGAICEKCHACAKSCPANAIPNGDRSTEPTSISNRNGIMRWTVNVEKCYLFWRENGVDCSNCIASCPWALRSPRDWLVTEG